jgi:hypothetical protein
MYRCAGVSSKNNLMIKFILLIQSLQSLSTPWYAVDGHMGPPLG